MAARPVGPHEGAARESGTTTAEERAAWEARTRVVLSPVAAPSILGLFGLSAATLVVASNLAGWWGTPSSLFYLAPFALVFGGVAQFLAGMWSYKARDGLATGVHGMWGSFWFAWGILELLMATGALPIPLGSATYFPALAFWFIMLGLLTLLAALAAIPRGFGMTGTLACLGAGSCLLAVSFLEGSLATREAGGWVLVASAGFAVYTASAFLYSEATGGRTVLPLGRAGREHNVPGRRTTWPFQYPSGMPGVKVGQ